VAWIAFLVLAPGETSKHRILSMVKMKPQFLTWSTLRVRPFFSQFSVFSYSQKFLINTTWPT
jgi:hypothetical protein